jgi:hypothetical protein
MRNLHKKRAVVERAAGPAGDDFSLARVIGVC